MDKVVSMRVSRASASMDWGSCQEWLLEQNVDSKEASSGQQALNIANSNKVCSSASSGFCSRPKLLARKPQAFTSLPARQVRHQD